MRVLRWLAGVLGFLVFLYSYFALVHPRTPVPDHPYFARAPRASAAWAIAHQGGRGLWPENTIYAFEHAHALGVDVLEMDLRVTQDGRFVVMHDATVDRTTNGTGSVREFSLDEIRALDAGYHFQDEHGVEVFRGKGLTVPTPSEVLSRFETRFVVEMKDFTPDEAVLLCELVRELGVETRTLVASFGQEPMVAFRERCPEVATSATLREGLLFYQLGRMRLGSLYESPAVALQVPERLGERQVVSGGFLELARELNLRVQVWTVNERADMQRLLQMGVQGVMTDYPDVLLSVLDDS